MRSTNDCLGGNASETGRSTTLFTFGVRVMNCDVGSEPTCDGKCGTERDRRADPPSGTANAVPDVGPVAVAEEAVDEFRSMSSLAPG